MTSLWCDTADSPGFEPLRGNKKTDVLIIGGGAAGLLCAHFLKQAGVDFLLVEANKICSGITKNTTAKISSQHGLIYHKLISRYGQEKAGMYLEANEAALAKYRELCKSIDCDFQEKSSYIYSMYDRKKLEDELNALHKLHFPAIMAQELPLPFETAGAVEFKNQAQFNPLKFFYALSKGLPIYEHTKVRELYETTALTENGRIEADKIIVATHFPFINKHGAYFIKMYQHRSYVIALENAPDISGMYLDDAKGGMSFRNYGDFLLLGGAGHKTGRKSTAWRGLEDFARSCYPGAGVKYRWATQDCITLDDIPYIGRYSVGTQGLYVATGFNKWGMTGSMAAGEILSEMVQGRQSKYEAVFSPSRSVLHPRLAANGASAVFNLLTPTGKRCPHLGCALKYNRQEHSWDCPCHGSRFSEDGCLIDNPATDGLDA